MTQSEYDARRATLVGKLSSPQSTSVGDRSTTNRSIKDIQLALQALDAEWARQQGTSKPRLGRMFISGEGK